MLNLPRLETTAIRSVHLAQRELEFKDYQDGLSPRRLWKVIDYIQTHLDQELGLAELAAITHLSPHYFTRLFKQSTGVTPHQYVIQCRVERARALLLAGEGFDRGYCSTSRICESSPSERAYQAIAGCYTKDDSRTAQESVKNRMNLKERQRSCFLFLSV